MLSNLIIPHHLEPGDKVATVSLSWGGAGDTKFNPRYLAGKYAIEDNFGLKVVEMNNTLKGTEYIDANPQARVDDLHQAFSDPDIKAVISCIGGSDSVRLIDKVDYSILRSNPKIFLGYSDSTVAHFICLKAGIRSYYGPSVMAGFAENGGMHQYLIDSVKKTLFGRTSIGEIRTNREGWTDQKMHWEDAEEQKVKRKMHHMMPWQFIQGDQPVTGRLIGGCTDVFPMFVGTSIWPDKNIWKDAILFLENSEEKISKDVFIYYMRNWGAQGILNQLKGIIFARPCNVAQTHFQDYDDALIQVCKEFGAEHLPIVTRMDFGHTDPMFVIPYGAKATIDPIKKTFSIDEAGCL